jgi:folate-dependent phosphoribosylglycinamide formyltransferase PurN
LSRGGDEVCALVEQHAIPDRPIRVVVFGGGPILEHDVQQFLIRLESHPEIELLGVFCESRGQSLCAIMADLWRRRRWLAIPLVALQVSTMLLRFFTRVHEHQTLKRQLAQLNGRIHYIPDIHAATILIQIRSLAPDLGLIYGSPILKPELFETPQLGTLGIHHGQVPKYRGKKTTFWAMYNNEPVAGVTIQKVNAGLDTGQIVNMGFVTACNRAYRAVWDELRELGLTLYIQSILQVKSGTAIYRPQAGPKGKLFRDPTLRDIWRFWRRRWRSQLLGK